MAREYRVGISNDLNARHLETVIRLPNRTYLLRLFSSFYTAGFPCARASRRRVRYMRRFHIAGTERSARSEAAARLYMHIAGIIPAYSLLSCNPGRDEPIRWLAEKGGHFTPNAITCFDRLESNILCAARHMRPSRLPHLEHYLTAWDSMTRTVSSYQY